VDADAGAADDLEVRRRRDQLFRHLGGGTDGETVIIADDLGELFLVLAELRLEIHVDAAVAKDLDGGFREFIGYEYARCHERPPSIGRNDDRAWASPEGRSRIAKSGRSLGKGRLLRFEG